MTGWVPIISDVVDSSLWMEKDYVIKVFFSMLAKKDKYFFCRGDIYTVARWANKLDSMDEVVDAINVLSSPDTKKPLVKQEFEGRRIQPVQGGWFILNGEKYRQMVSKFNERERKRSWAESNRRNNKQHTKSNVTRAERNYLDGVRDGTIDQETGNPIKPNDPEPSI